MEWLRRRNRVKRGDALVPTNSILLTFDRPDIPSDIRICYVRVHVRPLVPNPMRCYRCQRFGHTRQYYRNRPACGTCSSTDHTGEDCPSENPWCVNCGEGQDPNPSYDRLCPALTREKEILSVMSTQRLSFREARETCNKSHPKISYADAAKSAPKSSTSSEQMTLTRFIALLRSFGLTHVWTSDVSERSSVPAVPATCEVTEDAGRDGDGFTLVQRRRVTGRRSSTSAASESPLNPLGCVFQTSLPSVRRQ